VRRYTDISDSRGKVFVVTHGRFVEPQRGSINSYENSDVDITESHTLKFISTDYVIWSP
jgi:hypothetical protein